MVLAGFLAWPVLTAAQDAPRPALDSAGLLPPSRDPADVPSAADKLVMVPAVPMSDVMRQAIRLFDSGSKSERFYDLANCLDGLTFGFGNWPQPEIGDFFRALMADQAAGPTFIKRLMEVFTSDQAAWIAFTSQAAIQAPTPTEAVVRDGVDRLLVKSKMKRDPDGGCEPVPAKKGVAFYQDNKDWFVPVWSRAGRDPAIVAFQVAYWDKDVLKPAITNAKAMGLGPNGVFLLAFYESNPGEVPDLRSAVKAQRPPDTLRAGGRQWQWDKPPPHLNVDLDTWHNLLLWQAMCSGDKRMRSRNVTYFKQYLAPTFRLREETNGVPNQRSRDNCDPSKVTLRAK
jgi:hypothetical protein